MGVAAASGSVVIRIGLACAPTHPVVPAANSIQKISRFILLFTRRILRGNCSLDCGPILTPTVQSACQRLLIKAAARESRRKRGCGRLICLDTLGGSVRPHVILRNLAPSLQGAYRRRPK